MLFFEALFSRCLFQECDFKGFFPDIGFKNWDTLVSIEQEIELCREEQLVLDLSNGKGFGRREWYQKMRLKNFWRSMDGLQFIGGMPTLQFIGLSV